MPELLEAKNVPEFCCSQLPTQPMAHDVLLTASLGGIKCGENRVFKRGKIVAMLFKTVRTESDEVIGVERLD